VTCPELSSRNPLCRGDLDCLSESLLFSPEPRGKLKGGAVASDIFAKIGDIKGESIDDKHKDEIEVLSWSWGITNAVKAGGGGGGGTGKASFHDLSFTHKIDKASPVLMKGCATGQHLKEATITHRKAGKGQQEFLIIKMNDVVITAVAEDDNDENGRLETVSLAFAKVDLEYRPAKADGSLDAGIHFKYDIKANKEG
jgi:type VI secretion system secreted protein Hcp